MRVMLDTCVLISAVLGKKTNAWIHNVNEKHTIVLCTYVIEETKKKIWNKYPERWLHLKNLLKELQYELIVNNLATEVDMYIRDPNDVPVLEGAIIGKVDVIITLDKDFEDVETSLFKVKRPSEFN
ncbi:MAG: putative toxin-antitoxin system toxin component, PIN family [Clostridia bacterium]|nr:putative toxin-antitoxin system toxin component, PIN family [Clostridia bacterium]